MVKEDGIEKYMSTAKFVFLMSMQKKRKELLLERYLEVRTGSPPPGLIPH